MFVVQTWIGPTIPKHIVMCLNSLAKFAKPEDRYVLITDIQRPEIDPVYQQVDIMHKVSVEDKARMDKLKKIQQKVDFLRYLMANMPCFKGAMFVDADVLFFKDPREIFHTDKSFKLFDASYTKTPYPIIGLFLNNDSEQFRNLLERSRVIIDASDGMVRGKETVLQSLINEEMLASDPDEYDIEPTRTFFELSYGRYGKAVREGGFTDDVLRKLLADHVYGTHLYRPDNLVRADLAVMDDIALQVEAFIESNK